MYRPDFLFHLGGPTSKEPHLPIPLNPPLHFFEGISCLLVVCLYSILTFICWLAPVVPGIGAVMLSSFPFKLSISHENAWYASFSIPYFSSVLILCFEGGWEKNMTEFAHAGIHNTLDYITHFCRTWRTEMTESRYTRFGKELGMPDNYARRMPNSLLDSELWYPLPHFSLTVQSLIVIRLGRGLFNESQSIIKIDQSIANWSSVRFVLCGLVPLRRLMYR